MKQKKLTKAICVLVACFITLSAILFTTQADGTEYIDVIEYNGVEYGKITLSGHLGDGRMDFNIEDEIFNWSYQNVAPDSICTIEPFDFDGYMYVGLDSYILTDGVYRMNQRDDWMATQLLADGQATVGYGFWPHEGEFEPYFTSPGHPASFVFGVNAGTNAIYGDPYSFTLYPDGTLYVLQYEFYSQEGEFICKGSSPFFIKGEQDITPAYNATPTNSTVIVIGREIAFDAYNINDNNYFKLRDLAAALNKTRKQFEVTWDGDKNAINLVSNQPYTMVGGELSAGDGMAKNAQECTSEIYLNGEPVELTAYTIDDNNYFKLRDIGKLLDFGVFWDESFNTILIDTNRGYTEE